MKAMTEMNGQHKANVVKGALAGAIGGLVASWVMEEFQSVWKKIEKKFERSNGDSDSVHESPEEAFPLQRSTEAQPVTAQSAHPPKHEPEAEPANVKAAEIIAAKVLGKPLPDRQKPIAGELVHYAMGISSGAIYGAVAELKRDTQTGIGIPFGAAVWLLADELAVPALGL